MADLGGIRAALAANLAPLTGVQVSPYLLSNPTPPAVLIFPAEITYDLAMRRGLDKWVLTAQAFVGLSTDIGAQTRLDLLLASSGSQSVKTLLEADSTLGGLVADVNVTGCSGYRVYARDGAAPVIGAEWRIEVLATGT